MQAISLRDASTVVTNLIEMSWLSKMIPCIESALKGKAIAILREAKDSRFLGEITNRLD